MAQFFHIHPQTPQLRLIRRTVEILREDGVIVYPTESSYALGCRLDNKDGLERIRRIRQLGETHFFALVCKDVSQISTFAKIGNEAFRLIKSLTPGPYTFILNATREVPRRLLDPKRKTVGIRITDHAVSRLLVEELDEPLFTSTLIMPGEEVALSDPQEIRERLEKQVDLIIDSDIVIFAPTTVIGLTQDAPELIREGKGAVDFLH